MARNKQLHLFEAPPRRGRPPERPRGHFGGAHCKGYHPKMERPMETNKALHLVLRSSHARGSQSFKNRKFEEGIWHIIRSQAKAKSVRIYRYANAGNHLHLLIRAKHRDHYNAFIRAITGLIARLVGRSEKGRPLKRKFWDGRPFTRIVSFAQREFQAVATYLLRNTLEAVGWLAYTPRDKRLSPEVRDWLTLGSSSA